MGAIAITYKPFVLESFGYGYSTEGLLVMAVSLTSHRNFLTILAFLECFYMVLINKKQVWKESVDFFFHPIDGHTRLLYQTVVPEGRTRWSYH